MNTRERFRAIMSGDCSVRTFLWEFGYWVGTLRRWYDEGLEQRRQLPDTLVEGDTICGEGLYWHEGLDSPVDTEVRCELGFDHGFRGVQVDLGFSPPFEEKTITDEGDTVIIQDGMGICKRIRKDKSSIPFFISWPVKTEEDFDRLKERLRPALAERVPSNWSSLVEEYRQRDYPLVLGGHPYGFFGMSRYLMGAEELLVSFYQQPQLVHKMMDYLADFMIELSSQILDQAEIDCVHIWEDMAYRGGPLISPDMFRRFMLKPYRKLTEHLQSKGVEIILVDTDGDCRQLIPLFLEAGVTGLYPFEVQAGCDIVSIRNAYPEMQILGGIDKIQLSRGREAIETEVARCLPGMLTRGRYIPFADHLIPPDVSWPAYCYYRQLVKQAVEANGKT